MSKRLVLCLDGTWNNPYMEKERDDGSRVVKPTNTLKLCRAVLPMASDGTKQITYYDSGVGGLNRHPGVSNRLLAWLDNKLGGAWGAGFEGNIEDAYHFIAHNYETGDELFFFGFSRGAAQARGLARFVDWMGGIPPKADAYYIPRFFSEYLSSSGARTSAEVREAINIERAKSPRPQGPIRNFTSASVRFLGVWDTVMALGSRIRASQGTSVHKRAFHVGESPPSCVSVARQALAIDEKRYDFRPEIWQRAHDTDQSLEQRWFPGVHSNIGGGYVNDGLANLALHWIAKAAMQEALELDTSFLGAYKGYAQDRLHESRTTLYRLREAPLFGSGERLLLGLPPSANIEPHESAYWRLNSDPYEKKRGKDELRHSELRRPYRPKTLIDYIKSRPELDQHLPDDTR